MLSVEFASGNKRDLVKKSRLRKTQFFSFLEWTCEMKMLNSENVMIESSPTVLNISRKGGGCLELGLFYYGSGMCQIHSG
jgi:hypothetical protein